MADPHPNPDQQTQQQVSEPALQPARYCSKCAKCATGRDSLSMCSRCHVVLYCSRDCQRADWHLHKQFCSTWAEQKGRITHRGPPISRTHKWRYPHAHWHAIASQDAAAQQVAAAIGIKLSYDCPGQSCRAIDATFSHLICTGKDTEYNLGLFFGREHVPHILTSTVFLDLQYIACHRAPPGSYAFHAAQTWDRDMSQLFWTPRQALKDNFAAKFDFQIDYWARVLFYILLFNDQQMFGVKDLVRLVHFMHGMLNDPGHVWPFLDDRLDAIDGLRVALQTSPYLSISPEINLEANGLGFWYIPDEIPVLMRKEGIGLREAVDRVIGAGCGHSCARCGCDWPVWVLHNNNDPNFCWGG